MMRAICGRPVLKALFAALILVAQLVPANTARAGAEAVGVGNYVFVPPVIGAGVAAGLEPGAGAVTVSSDKTQQVVSAINSGIAFCLALSQDVYSVDCLSNQLEIAARTLPKTGDYADARKALMTASSKLHGLVSQYRDYKVGRGYARGGKGGMSSTRLLTPVRPEALPEVKRKAAAIVAEAQTVLLRSAETSALRKIHYEQIAAAVGSANKVLLRSA